MEPEDVLFAIVLVLLAIAIGFAAWIAISGDESPAQVVGPDHFPSLESGGRVLTTWTEVEPPHEGLRCWLTGRKDGSAETAVTYSGVYCEPIGRGQ